MFLSYIDSRRMLNASTIVTVMERPVSLCAFHSHHVAKAVCETELQMHPYYGGLHVLHPSLTELGHRASELQRQLQN